MLFQLVHLYLDLINLFLKGIPTHRDGKSISKKFYKKMLRKQRIYARRFFPEVYAVLEGITTSEDTSKLALMPRKRRLESIAQLNQISKIDYGSCTFGEKFVCKNVAVFGASSCHAGVHICRFLAKAGARVAVIDPHVVNGRHLANTLNGSFPKNGLYCIINVNFSKQGKIQQLNPLVCDLHDVVFTQVQAVGYLKVLIIQHFLVSCKLTNKANIFHVTFVDPKES